jgi:hypothetical protein
MNLEVISMNSSQARSGFHHLTGIALVLVALLGCNASPPPNPPPGPGGTPPLTDQTASVNLTIEWPQATALNLNTGLSPLETNLNTMLITVHQDGWELGEATATRAATEASTDITVNFPRPESTTDLTITAGAFAGSATGDAVKSAQFKLDPNQIDAPPRIKIGFGAVARVDVKADRPTAQKVKQDCGVKLTATPRDANGTQVVITYNSIQWRSDDPSVAPVTQILDLLDPVKPKPDGTWPKPKTHEEAARLQCLKQGITFIRARDPLSGKEGSIKITVSDDARSSPFDGVWTGTLTDGRFNPTKLIPMTYTITSNPPNLNFAYDADFLGKGSYTGTFVGNTFSAAGGVVVGSVSGDGNELTAVQANAKQSFSGRRATSVVLFQYFVAATRRQIGGNIEVDFVIRNNGTTTATNVRLTKRTLNGFEAIPSGGDNIYPYGPDYGTLRPGEYIRRTHVFGSNAVPDGVLGTVPFVISVSSDQLKANPDAFDVSVLK